LLFFTFSIAFAQNVGLDPLRERQFGRGVGIGVNVNTRVNAVNMSTVVNLSNDPMDERNFGRYIEMVHYLQENEKIIYVYIVYSNLKTISVEIGDILLPGELIGYSGGEGTIIHNTNDFFIYVYTREDSQNLRVSTNNAFLFEDGIYWWNPSAIFSFGN
jgi:hypothetical protein